MLIAQYLIIIWVNKVDVRGGIRMFNILFRDTKKRNLPYDVSWLPYSVGERQGGYESCSA